MVTSDSSVSASRRRAIFTLVGSPLVATSLDFPKLAWAIDECLTGCVEECTRLVPGGDDYCNDSCQTYCKEKAGGSSAATGSQPVASIDQLTPVKKIVSTSAPVREKNSIGSITGDIFNVNKLMQQEGKPDGY
jgi:hypothetical protein